MSIPFTWLLPKSKKILTQLDFSWDNAIVGGPAVMLMPEYLSDILNVEKRDEYPGILQMINPLATRTTLGCPNKCKFCGIGTGKIECCGFVELNDWHDAPILCDNNLLAASIEHFDKVIDRLIKHGWADFNQGLDCRLLNEHHAKRFREIDNPKIRLALDGMNVKDTWQRAFDLLRNAGIKKREITSYCIIGFNTGIEECWERCNYIDKHNIDVYPMWYHPLDSLEWNQVTDEQRDLGWNNHERARIMGYYYKRRGVPLVK